MVARLNAEAEFRAIVQGVCELLRVKMLMKDLRCPIVNPMNLCCDNKAAIDIAHPNQHDPN